MVDFHPTLKITNPDGEVNQKLKKPSRSIKIKKKGMGVLNPKTSTESKNKLNKLLGTVKLLLLTRHTKLVKELAPQNSFSRTTSSIIKRKRDVSGDMSPLKRLSFQ